MEVRAGRSFVKTVDNILFKMDVRRVGAFPLLESWRAK